MKKKDLRIIFMGTPEFAVPTMKKLIDSGFNVVAVITAPDKPAGRGKKITISAVKKAAELLALPILQPENLKDEEFINQLESINANLQIVVAFRMLPKVVWAMPELGTFNLHASLLPQYRGAAPINHAIINGEKETGLTTFMLDNEIDTGAIIKQVRIPIADNETAEHLHNRMMEKGADLVIETVEEILSGKADILEQKNLLNSEIELKKAPKINKEDCRINWENGGKQVIDLIRGLCSQPAAFSEFVSEKGEVLYLKILKAIFEKVEHSSNKGSLISDNIKYIKVATKDGFVHLVEIQQSGKKKMDVHSFLRGNSFEGNWIAKI